MATNIRFIFLKKGNEVIVKAQYNESDLKLPLEAYSGSYYRWSDFFDYYSERIAEAVLILSEYTLNLH